ncbi:hypothetical protein CDL12_10552 [Handroanthus impetiginosus]|uniref:Uncharacterized protein n=1 Tax=Handroanthus impetiginosus TaxID=429701 RepID=A0A2G9HH13_9LAMI|nr:hypothetical protein CDL12_10552 [Handroanthus impetiginosus]
MGCSFSCKRLSSSSKPSKNIKIIHLDGYIQEFDYPLTVAEVTGKPAKHVLFTQAQQLSAGSSPLKLDARLELGRIYFSLPFSLFESNVSPVDLAPVARKLASMAQKASRSKSKSGQQNLSSGASCSSPVWRSPARSSTTDNSLAPYESQKSSKLSTWKPILATIRERSFHQRSESDLQQNLG